METEQARQNKMAATTREKLHLDLGSFSDDEETNLDNMCYRGLDLQVSSTRSEEMDIPTATANKKAIVSEARKLVAMADEFVEHYHDIQKQKNKESQDEFDGLDSFENYMRTMSHALNEALAFLESPIVSQLNDDANLAQYEGVLRGVFQLMDLGSVMFSFGLLPLISRVLALTSNSYQAERNYINRCIEDVELNQIKSKVDEAAKILKELVENPKLVRTIHMALKFDNVVREAWLDIESCQSKLKGIEEAIDNLLLKVQGKRCFYVLAKYGFLAGMFLSIRHLYKNNVISGNAAVGIGAANALFWCLSPTTGSRGEELYKELTDMQYKHKFAQGKLGELKKRLRNHEGQHKNIRKNHKMFAETPTNDDTVQSLPVL